MLVAGEAAGAGAERVVVARVANLPVERVADVERFADEVEWGADNVECGADAADWGAGEVDWLEP